MGVSSFLMFRSAGTRTAGMCCGHYLKLGPGTGFQVGGTAHQHQPPPADATVDKLFLAGTSGSFQSSSREGPSVSVCLGSELETEAKQVLRHH